MHFDYLIVAVGMRPGYFGHDEFSAYAPSLKTISDAEAIRAKILAAYELAELAEDAEERARQMTFVLVGAGPTGVELAASIAQIATSTLRSNFRRIDPAKTSIILIDAVKRIFPSLHETLSAKAAKHLARDLVGRPTTRPFHHHDKGNMAVVGRKIRDHGSPPPSAAWDAELARLGADPHHVPSSASEPPAGSNPMALEPSDGSARISTDPGILPAQSVRQRTSGLKSAVRDRAIEIQSDR